MKMEDVDLINTKDNLAEEEDLSKSDEPSIYKFCPSCGFNNENLFKFCPSCGSPLTS